MFFFLLHDWLRLCVNRGALVFRKNNIQVLHLRLWETVVAAYVPAIVAGAV